MGACLEARVPPLPAMTSSWRVAWGTSAPRHPSPHPRILTALPVASGTRQELPMERHLPSRPAVTKVRQGSVSTPKSMIVSGTF